MFIRTPGEDGGAPLSRHAIVSAASHGHGVEEGPTWIHDDKNLFAQRSRCTVPTSCSASCNVSVQ